MHLAGPFAVGLVDEVLAEAGGAAVVDRQHRIAAVGQPLVVAAVAVVVARPRAAVHQQHHRHRLVGLAVVVGVGGLRQAQVTDQGQAVARLDLLRPHRDQRLAVQRRARGEQLFRLAAAHVAVIDRRGFGGGVGDDPGLVVLGACADAEVAGADRLQRLHVGGDRGIDDLPLVAEVVDRDRLRLVGVRVVDGAGDVGARVLVHQRLRAGGNVDRVKRSGVASARVEEVLGLAVAGVAAGEGGQRIGERNLADDLPAALAIRFQQVAAAIRARLGRHPHLEVRSGDVAGELAGILLHQGALAARQVDAVEIVPLRVAVVHGDQHRARMQVAQADHLRARVREIAEVARFAGGQVHREQVEVLVAAGVAHVQQGVRVVAPEVLTDAARLVGGHRARLAGVICRCDPDIHHPVDRGDPAQVFAVRADLHVAALGIAEQGVARDQFDVIDRSRCCGGRGGLGGRLAWCAVAGGEQAGSDRAGDERAVQRHGVSPWDPTPEHTETMSPADMPKVRLRHAPARAPGGGSRSPR